MNHQGIRESYHGPQGRMQITFWFYSDLKHCFFLSLSNVDGTSVIHCTIYIISKCEIHTCRLSPFFFFINKCELCCSYVQYSFFVYSYHSIVSAIENSAVPLHNTLFFT